MSYFARVGMVAILLAGAAGAALAAQAASAPSPGQLQARLNGIRTALFSGTGSPDAAIRELKDILAIDPGSAEGHMLLGIAYRTAGQPEFLGEAVAELRQALEISPAFVPARVYLAHIYKDLGRNERAREELSTALGQAPKNVQVLTLLGEVERQLKNPTRAIDVLTRAIAIDGTSAQARYYLGLALLDFGRPAEAIAELERVVKGGEQRADVYVSLGAAYLEAGRLDEGLAILNQAARIDAGRADIRIQLARAYRLKGMLDKADAQMKLAAPKGPASVASPLVQQGQVEFDFYLEQGLLDLAQGQLAGAEVAFRKVLDMDPNHGPTNNHMADVALRQGQYARALEYATKAEQLGFPLAADKRKRLQDKLESTKKQQEERP